MERTAKCQRLGAEMSLFWFRMRKRSVQLKFRKPGHGVGAEALEALALIM